ncbi:MAG: ATP-binding protein [Acidimicrobiales bacterium]
MSVSLRAPSYRRRVIDDELDVLLESVAAISLEGAKGVGKSATAAERVDHAFALEDATTRALVEADPGRITAGRRVLLDEWQHLPSTWDLVRRSVDRGAAAGQFLLTGSASVSDPGRHSGAGRILQLRMRPLSLAERGHRPTVRLADLLTGRGDPVTGHSDVDLHRYVTEIVASGLPGIRGLPDRARRAQLDSYVQRIVERDVPELGMRVRNPSLMMRWMRAFAAASSTTTALVKIAAAAASGGGQPPVRATVEAYRGALERLFVLDEVPGWQPGRSHLRELATSPKHQLADPALAVALLGVDEHALLAGDEPGVDVPRDGPLLGALFESLVTLSVKVYAQASESAVSHFRTHRGEREVDLIVERRDGRCVALEVKLSPVVTDDDVKQLRWLQGRLGPDLLDAAVITTGRDAYRRPDGIAVIPAALLGP